jgi:hypothetical protein
VYEGDLAEGQRAEEVSHCDAPFRAIAVRCGMRAGGGAADQVDEHTVELDESRPRMEFCVVARENVIGEIRCGVTPNSVDMVDVSLRVVVLGK